MSKPIETAIRTKIENEFQPTYVELENESANHSRGGDETHFRLLIVSPLFEGKSRVDRQRSVQNLFAEERAAGLHALALWTYTPAEYARLKGQGTESPPCAGQE